MQAAPSTTSLPSSVLFTFILRLDYQSLKQARSFTRSSNVITGCGLSLLPPAPMLSVKVEVRRGCIRAATWAANSRPADFPDRLPNKTGVELYTAADRRYNVAVDKHKEMKLATHTEIAILALIMV